MTQPAAAAAWTRTEAGFLECHRARLNVELHLLTTPLGLFCAAWLLATLQPGASLAISGVYGLYLALRVPAPLGAVSAAVALGLGVAGELAPPGLWLPLLGLVVAYVVQELAHHASGERTFQSTYQGDRGWVARLAEHTLLLLPLVLRAAVEGPLPFLGRLVPERGATFARITGEPLAQAMRRVRAWVEAHTPATDRTTHIWRRDLEGAVREDVDRLATDPQLLALVRRHHGPGWEVEPVHDMNEVYVTGPEKDRTSDTVFYLPHVDGPWAVWPGGAVYRCMLALSPNPRITTHFPMAGAERADAVTIDDGEVAAFDFNRELHFITCDPDVPQPGLRINLKLHFVAYPRGLRPWGRLLAWLTARYDEQARDLFLFTIDPKTPAQRLAAAYVLATTRGFAVLHRTLGPGNLAYAGLLALVSVAIGAAWPWVLGVSFLHYLYYIAVFHARGDVGFRTFLRDVVFYKALSMGTLAACALAAGGFTPLSIGMVVAGVALSASAAHALGWLRTYFGVELGLAAPARVTRFPYGVIPHPMIVGSALALTGLYLAPALRAAWPWLVPAHLAFYALHLAQEAFDRRAPHVRAPLSG